MSHDSPGVANGQLKGVKAGLLLYHIHFLPNGRLMERTNKISWNQESNVTVYIESSVILSPDSG